MRIFADSNWLVATFFVKDDQHRSHIVRRFSEKADFPILISLPVLFECRNTFALPAGENNGSEWKDLSDAIGTRISIAEVSWESIAAKGEDLSGRFSHKARLGAMDMLILASALNAEATHFLSFDSSSNLRALASVLKLKVFPELTAEDRRRAAALR